MPDYAALQQAVDDLRLLLEIKQIKSLTRDVKEPQVKEKAKAEAAFAKALEAFFNKQNARLVELVKPFVPVKSALSDLLDSAFDDQDAELREIIRKHLLRMAIDGQHGAIERLSESHGLGVDWAITSAQAEKWARQYSADLVKEISGNTRKRINEAVATYIASPGADLQTLIDSIEQKNISEYRASVIAITETTRAYSQGATQAWGEMGVGKMVWQANHDEIQCPYCSAVDGKVKTIGAVFGENAEGEEITQPPMHVNCRCWLSPVVD